MDPRGALGGTRTDARDERDHELRAALFGIEAVAQGLNCQHDRLTTQQLFELTSALAAEARRLQSLLDPPADQPTAFDLAEAIRPVIASFRTSGLDVRSQCRCGIEVEGRRDDTAQAVFTLLDNARKHAAMSAIDVRAHGARCGDDALRRGRRDRDLRRLCERLFERGARGDEQRRRGLGLFIARRLMDRTGRIARRAPDPVAAHRSPSAAHARVQLPRADPRDPALATVLAMTARVLIVEDHALVAIGLQLALSARGWDVETTDGPTAADVIDHAAASSRSACCSTSTSAKASAAASISSSRCAPPAPTWSCSPPRPAAPCWPPASRQGAAGWVGKDAFLDEVVAALHDVLDGTPLIGCAAREAMIDELRIERAGLRRALSPFERLTARERDVLAALVDGLSAEEIAETQFVALTTVRSQIRAVLQKLGVRSQLAAVAHANRVGWSLRGQPALRGLRQVTRNAQRRVPLHPRCSSTKN